MIDEEHTDVALVSLIRWSEPNLQHVCVRYSDNMIEISPLRILRLLIFDILQQNVERT